MSQKTSSNRIGAHVSTAGGIDKAPERAAAVACETFQCFSRPPQGGKAPELKPEIVSNFKAEMAKYGIKAFYIHTPYLINLASLEPRIRHSSIAMLREELERGSMLNALYVMTHTGSHKDQTLEEGLSTAIKSIKSALDGFTGNTKLLLEIAAGSGNVLGDTFEEIGEMIHELKGLSGFGGVCFDTAHAFASGYDFRTPDKAKRVIEDFDKHIGLDFLKLSHVNDSKVDFGMKRDLHEHIGKGFIKEEGIASLLKTKQFQNIDWILETEPEGREHDIAKLKKIRDLSAGK